MEFFKHIQFYILIFIFFGLWTSIQHFKYEYLLRIYRICSLILVFSLIFFSIYVNPIYTTTNISNIVANFLFVLTMSTRLVIAIESIVRRLAQSQLIEKFILVDQLFETKLDVKIAYAKEILELSIVHLIVIFIVIPARLVVFTYTFYVGKWSGSSIDILLSFWAFSLRPMQVVFFVNLIRNRLKLMRQRLKSVSLMSTTQDDKRVFTMLLHLKQIYTELYNICELINISFGSSFLIILIQSFMEFTLCAYWIYLAGENYVKICYFVGILIQNAAILYTLTLGCSNCSQQVRSQ